MIRAYLVGGLAGGASSSSSSSSGGGFQFGSAASSWKSTLTISADQSISSVESFSTAAFTSSDLSSSLEILVVMTSLERPKTCGWTSDTPIHSTSGILMASTCLMHFWKSRLASAGTISHVMIRAYLVGGLA